MSFLAPLYVLGALGIGLPILFHLIRRQPRGQMRFSSLMFLRPTPPTLTRRSRLENWPLLLLRALALILLAAAFARPFLRSPLTESQEAPGKRIVLLVDTSASMRRIGLWQQANQVARNVLNNLKRADQIAIISFDSKQEVELSFEQSSSLDLEARREAASQAIRQLQPTWAASDLGNALIFAADLLATTEADAPPGHSSDDFSGATPRSLSSASGHIVVISDMQAGNEQNLNSLQAYNWPKEIKAEIRIVASNLRTNAFVSIVQPRDEDPDEANDSKEDQSNQGKIRVRVSNSVDAMVSDFSIFWTSAAGEPIEATRMPIHLGPGESRVIRMIEPPRSVTDTTALCLVLSGDDHDFDNTRYITRPQPIDQQLLFIGPTIGEPRESLLYYLQRAPLDNRRRIVAVSTAPTSAVPESIDVKKTPLVIVADAVAGPTIQSLKSYVSAGGKLLWVLDKNTNLSSAQQALSVIAETPALSVAEAQIKDYAMWGKIDFSDPLFMPLADARYNDFTKIRFWSHRKISGLAKDCRIIATFDDGDPAIVLQSIGKGQLWMMTSGWQPTNSQLALSTKFVPLLDGFFSFGDRGTANIDQLAIGDEPPFVASANARIEQANNAPIEYRAVEDFSAVDQPGFYRFVDGDIAQPFAVNVAQSESFTQPLAVDELERYGVVMGTIEDSASAIVSQRQQRDFELEGRQRLWQFMLVAVLFLLALESWLSGYLDRKQHRPALED